MIEAQARERDPVAGLSDKQRVMLRSIRRLTIEGELEGQDLAFWGIKWLLDTTNASESAATSRALRRLEARGLVVRMSQKSGGRRTTHVRITPAGRAAAACMASSEAIEGNG